MRAINGSTASSTSLNTVGNGVIKPSPIKANPALEAGVDTKKANNEDTVKTVNSKSSKNDKNAKNTNGKTSSNSDNEITAIILDKDDGSRKHEGKLGIANMGTRSNTRQEKVGTGITLVVLVSLSSEMYVCVYR